MNQLAETTAGSFRPFFDEDRFEQLWPSIYPQLKQIAHHRLQSLRPGQTLSATALVHELYLKLADQDTVQVKDLDHLMALSSKLMRYILVDYHRHKNAQKRAADAITLEEQSLLAETQTNDLIKLSEALDQMESLSPRMALIVECRVFGGLQNVEIAKALDLSLRTVEREWLKAKMFLKHELQAEEPALTA